MSNYNGNIEKRKAAQDLMKNRRENTSKYFFDLSKLTCIGSRKRIIKIEKYVISSILYGYFYNGGRFLDIPVYPSW